MAFITMIFAFFVMGLGVISLAGFVISVILAIVFSRKKSKSGKIIKTVSCVFICLSIVGMLPMMLILGFSLVQSATVPKEFVDVEVIAEIREGGFITSDGREFKELPYMHYNIEEREACFAVKPEGFFNRGEWGNIYDFDADGKTLYIYTSRYYSDVIIYCEADCYDEVLSYFEENSRWMQDFGNIPCSAEAVAIVEKYKAMDGAAEYGISWLECEEAGLECLSNDDAILLDECTFLKYNDNFYIYTYYIIEDYYHYYGFELTAEEAEIVENEFFVYAENR